MRVELYPCHCYSYSYVDITYASSQQFVYHTNIHNIHNIPNTLTNIGAANWSPSLAALSSNMVPKRALCRRFEAALV